MDIHISMHYNRGSMMLGAYFTGNEELFVHGALFEYAYELVDLIFIMFNLDAWGLNALKPEFRQIMTFHHLTGLSLTIPVCLSFLLSPFSLIYNKVLLMMTNFNMM